MRNTPDVLIIGGGIIGLTAAYVLAKAGLRVEVVDQGELGKEASWAGAGIIPPGNPAFASSPIDHLRSFSTSQFPRFSADLANETGINNGFFHCGGIECLSDNELDAVELWRQERIQVEEWSPAQLQQSEPSIVAPIDRHIFRLPEFGQVRNPWHLAALIAGCEKRGVTLAPNSPAAHWVFAQSEVTGVQMASGEIKQAAKYLVASGAWAEIWLEPLGVRPGVHPVRGQIVLFRAEKLLFSHVVMVGKRYLVPRPDGRVLVGSTEEPEAGFTKANTEAGVAELIAFATALVPKLKDAEIEKTWSGLRPGSPDGMPFIGPVPHHPNVFAAVGHFRAGVQLSVGTAQILHLILTNQPSPIPIEAFRVDRTPDLTARPAFRS